MHTVKNLSAVVQITVFEQRWSSFVQILLSESSSTFCNVHSFQVVCAPHIRVPM